jgi:hypothetical protein
LASISREKLRNRSQTYHSNISVVHWQTGGRATSVRIEVTDTVAR